MKKKLFSLLFLIFFISGSTFLIVHLKQKTDEKNFRMATRKLHLLKDHLQQLQHQYLSIWTNHLLSKMTVKEKLGQCFMIGWPGKTITPELTGFLKNFHIGNIILLARNYDNPTQLQKITNQLQTLAMHGFTPLPLWIATDQEGGHILHLKKGFTQFAGNMALAATGDPELARLQGLAIATELKAVGVNLNFAPSADTLTAPDNQVIGTRAFSSNPETVSRFTLAFLKGQHQGGILSTLKHFPGHGGSSSDSHLTLPINQKTAPFLWREEIISFQAPLKSNWADLVMSAHIYYPGLNLSQGQTATFSKKVLRNLLRKKLGFSGVIITDDLEMAGASNNLGVAKAALKAFKAGCDLLLISHTALYQKKAYTQLLHAVNQSNELKKRLQESAFRIVYKKIQQYGLGGLNFHFPSPVDLKKIRQNSHLALEKTIAEKSITLVGKAKNFSLIQQLTKKNETLLVLAPTTTFGQTMRNFYPALDIISVGFQPKPGQLPALLLKIKSKLPYYNKVILGLTSPEHAKIADFLLKNNKQTILLSLLNPYDLLKTHSSLSLASYFYGKTSLEALFSVLFKKSKATGKLPVTFLP